MNSPPFGARRFHLRVAAVVLEQDQVLLHRLERDDFWALPGGRVEVGELAKHAILREFLEELNVEVRCDHLLGVGENFFEHEGEPYHEIGLYFSVALSTEAAVRAKDKTHIGVEGNRRLEFKWFAVSQLAAINFQPKTLRESLSVGQFPQHFVQRC